MANGAASGWWGGPVDPAAVEIGTAEGDGLAAGPEGQGEGGAGGWPSASIDRWARGLALPGGFQSRPAARVWVAGGKYCQATVWKIRCSAPLVRGGKARLQPVGGIRAVDLSGGAGRRGRVRRGCGRCGRAGRARDRPGGAGGRSPGSSGFRSDAATVEDGGPGDRGKRAGPVRRQGQGRVSGAIGLALNREGVVVPEEVQPRTCAEF